MVDHLFQALDSLLKSQVTADFTISCKGREFKVHKAIISLQSSFFKSVCTLPFKVSIADPRCVPSYTDIDAVQETGEDRLELVDEEPHVIARVLLFLYTGDYDEAKIPECALQKLSVGAEKSSSRPGDKVNEPFVMTTVPQNEISNSRYIGAEEGEIELSKDAETKVLDRPPECPTSSIEINILVYCAADKFNIRPLKQLAKTNFKDCLTEELDFESLGDVAVMVFSMKPPDDGIRLELFDWCFKHSKTLDKRIDDILLQHEPISHCLATRLTEELVIEQQRLEDTEKELRTSRAQQAAWEQLYTEAKAETTAAEAETKAFRQHVGEFINKYNARRYCSSCGSEFQRTRIATHAQFQGLNTTSELYFNCPECGTRQ